MSDLSSIGMLEQNNTDEGVTSSDVADPSPLPDICGFYVLVRPVSTKPEKVGSLYVPDSVQDDVKYLCNVGRILAIGPHAFQGASIEKYGPWVQDGMKEGNFVQWERFVGKRFRYKGVNLVLLKDTDIHMRVENPLDLDSFANIEG